jgi:calcium-binding protein CML
MSNKQQVELDDEQIAELREIFRSFDRNNDGSLTQLELGSLLRSLGLKPSPEQLETLTQKADKNSNGLVEFSEFVALVAPDLLPAKSAYTEEQLRRLFGMFDRDGNGFITAAELAHSMAKLGHALTADELTGMIKEADTDGDGRINFHEFSQAITSAAFDNSWAWMTKQWGFVFGMPLISLFSLICYLFLAYNLILLWFWSLSIQSCSCEINISRFNCKVN